MQGKGELIIKDTDLSCGTSSRAGRQPSLTKEAEPEVEKVIRNSGTLLSNSVSVSLCTSALLFYFPAYPLSLLLALNLVKCPLSTSLILVWFLLLLLLFMVKFLFSVFFCFCFCFSYIPPFEDKSRMNECMAGLSPNF